MKLSNAGRILAVALAAYIVCDILLTPPAGLETRDPAKVTGLGFAVLGLLFIGLVLGIVALVLLFRGSPRAPMVAIVAAVLYLPAFLAEQAGLFSALRPPIAIERVELVQAVVAVIAIGLASWSLDRRPRGLRTASSRHLSREFREIVAKTARGDLRYVGIALRRPADVVRTLTKRLSLLR